jgi:hypothetical protein
MIKSPPRDGLCLNFWYHAYGKDVDDLNVYVKKGEESSRIWRMSGNQGNQWRPAAVTILEAFDFQVTKSSSSLYLKNNNVQI